MIKMVLLIFTFKKHHFYLLYLRLMEHLPRGKISYESDFSFSRKYGVVFIEVEHLNYL